MQTHELLEVTCPRCGHSHADPTPGSHVVHCVKCGKNFNPDSEK